MHKKFQSLDKAKKGFVSIDDIGKIPEIEKNPLRYYICQYLANKSGSDNEISFECFVKILDVFKSNKLQDQYKCNYKVKTVVFDLFDFDKDGRVNAEDLIVNLKLLLLNSLNEEQIKDIVEKTIQDYSSDGEYITFDEFLKVFYFLIFFR